MNPRPMSERCDSVSRVKVGPDWREVRCEQEQDHDADHFVVLYGRGQGTDLVALYRLSW